MGHVTGNWITGAHSGRACKEESIYTRVNKKTGACYTAKLCHPNTDWTDKQLAKRALFGKISAALSAWIKTNQGTTAEDYADYVKVKKAFDRQKKYATLRGYMYAKGMFVIGSDGTVTVDITANTSTAGSENAAEDAAEENTQESGGSNSENQSGGSSTPSGDNSLPE